MEASEQQPQGNSEPESNNINESKELDTNPGNAEKPIEIQIDQEKLDAYIAKLKLDQNVPMAITAGMTSAVVMALIWAAITVATNYQIGYMAVAVGLVTGFAVQFLGKGMDMIFGVIGAGFALLGCLMGNFFSVVGFIADAEGLGYFETYQLIELSMIPDLMMETFSPMDLLFYGIAIYEGYKFSFRNVSEEEIIANAAVSE